MKNISGKTLIFYTFQSQSKNVQFNITTFKKSAPQEPKIRDVLYQLPLDFVNNSFHFRFRSQFFEGDQKIIGWIDISNLLAKVPLINNSIFVKILQLPGDKQNKLFNKQKLKAIGLIDPQGANTSSYNKSGYESTPSRQPIRNIGNNNINQPKNSNNKDKQLLNDQKSKTSIINQGADFLDFQKGLKNDKKVQQSSTKSGVYIPGSQTPQQRLDAFQKQCQQEQKDRVLQRQAITFHEAKLTEWGYSGHKTINNLTTLLATLHTIWPQWQPVSLSDMLRPQDVSALYKKVVIKLHPDKNVDKDYQTKYLAKRIFQLLNQAKKAQK